MTAAIFADGFETGELQRLELRLQRGRHLPVAVRSDGFPEEFVPPVEE